MNGVHDMGGCEGLGVLDPADAATFHAPWEARVHALVLAAPTRGNIDAGRHRRERIPGPDYLAMRYYERWLAALEAMLVEGGHLTPAELAAGRADPAAPRVRPRLPADEVEAFVRRRGSYARPAPRPPLFGEGAAVRARNLHPEGHTRLPRYVRGRTGLVVRALGVHVFPDAHAAGRGEDPQPLYTVAFTARELFGARADPRDEVRLDLFEPYLEPA